MKNTFLYATLLAMVVLSGCITSEDTVYFQGGQFAYDGAQLVENANSQYKLQPNDVLSIKVKSQKFESTDFLNMEPNGAFNNPSPLSVYISGYSISEGGEIHMPSIGTLKVGGLSLSEAREVVQEAVNVYFNDATAFIYLVSFKVSVLGEVRNPGYHYINNNQGNVLEALALSGDMSEYANRKEVHLIRQVPKGSEVIKLDFTKPDLFSSPYFYLRPNDVLYVPQLEIKNQRSNLANLNILNVAFTGLSTAVTVILLVNNLKNTN